MSKYPEHDKLHKVVGDSQTIGEFLNWMNRTGYCVATFNERYHRLDEVSLTTQELLAGYYHIDLETINKEKNQMIEELRAMNAQGDKHEIQSPGQ